MKVIGLSAKKQGGKTTFAEMISNEIDLKYREYSQSGTPNNIQPCSMISFAYALKEIILKCFVPLDWHIFEDGLDREEIKTKVTPCGKTIRELLQIVGTDMFRQLWPDVWINALKNRISDIGLQHTFIITDVRFPNELKFIQEECGGQVIRLLRGNYSDAHKSETALEGLENKFDKIIDNRNMTLEELQEQAKQFVKENF